MSLGGKGGRKKKKKRGKGKRHRGNLASLRKGEKGKKKREKPCRRTLLVHFASAEGGEGEKKKILGTVRLFNK